MTKNKILLSLISWICCFVVNFFSLVLFFNILPIWLNVWNGIFTVWSVFAMVYWAGKLDEFNKKSF